MTDKKKKIKKIRTANIFLLKYNVKKKKKKKNEKIT
jgi:hypothetical protein